MRPFKYDVVQLIHGIRDRPCLWDKTIENYKDRVERRSAWEEIFNLLEEKYEDMTAEEKRLTGEHILNKWTNIRDTFVKSLKIKMGRPKRKYILYEHLKFLTKITPEEFNIEENEFTNDSDEEITYNVKQEDEIEISELPETTYIPKKRSKRFTIDEIDTSNSSNTKKSKTDFDDLICVNNEENQSTKKRSKRLSDSKESNLNKKKSKRRRSKSFNEDDNLTDIDFVGIDETDNPRVMNEDEAFFASLLPTIVKYSEDERLEFRIEVLGVMKKIKDKRKWSD